MSFGKVTLLSIPMICNVTGMPPIPVPFKSTTYNTQLLYALRLPVISVLAGGIGLATGIDVEVCVSPKHGTNNKTEINKINKMEYFIGLFYFDNIK